VLDSNDASRTYCSGLQTKDPATAGDTGRGLGVDRLWQEVIHSRAVGCDRPARWVRTYHGEPWRQVPPCNFHTRSEAAVVETALVAGVRLDRSLRWSSLTDQTKPGQRRALTNRCLPPQGEGRGEAVWWPGMVRATRCPAPQEKLEGRRLTPESEDDDGPQGTEYAARPSGACFPSPRDCGPIPRVSRQKRAEPCPEHNVQVTPMFT
jgi:hypothetical protein